MYVIRHHIEPISGRTFSCMLTEMSKLQFLKAEQNERCRYEPVNASYAHTWVRNGGLHETALWVDQGRIRRARG
jgi:hypothetical protein